MKRYIITATGTDVGKTLTAAILMAGLNADYWKPIQCGEDNDTQTVKKLTGIPDDHFHEEAHIFKTAASPHYAAELENTVIDVKRLNPPATSRTLLIEGAGGLMVPANRQTLMIDVFKGWNIPVILCARTELGTINHTLLSIEALKTRAMPIHGIVFIGAENKDSMRTILDFSGVKMLGHIPVLENVSTPSLQNVFDECFNSKDF